MAENDVSIWVKDDDAITVSDRDRGAPGCVVRFGEGGSLLFLTADNEAALRELLNARAKILRFPARARPRPAVTPAIDEMRAISEAWEREQRSGGGLIDLPVAGHINGPFGPDVA